MRQPPDPQLGMRHLAPASQRIVHSPELQSGKLHVEPGPQASRHLPEPQRTLQSPPCGQDVLHSPLLHATSHVPAPQ